MRVQDYHVALAVLDTQVIARGKSGEAGSNDSDFSAM
jgi:CO/xanthine dehydrogenase FAD-binding subunit